MAGHTTYNIQVHKRGVLRRVREEKARLSPDPHQPIGHVFSVCSIVGFCNKACVLVCVHVAGHPAQQWRSEPGDGGGPRGGGGVEGMWPETPLRLPRLRRRYTSPGPVTWPEVGAHRPTFQDLFTNLVTWFFDWFIEVWTTDVEVWTTDIEVWNPLRFETHWGLNHRHWGLNPIEVCKYQIPLFASWLFADLLVICMHACGISGFHWFGQYWVNNVQNEPRAPPSGAVPSLPICTLPKLVSDEIRNSTHPRLEMWVSRQKVQVDIKSI